jgi:chromatin remodeling complex protein RSC6
MPAKKSTKEVVVQDQVVQDQVVTNNTTETTTEPVEVDRFVAVLEKLQEFANGLKETIAHVKFLQKEHIKLQKQTSKKTKKVATGGQRTLSGFAKPSQLSEELCEFMGVAKGTSMARTEVTRMINEYIKKNNLQDASDKRHILPDAKLKKILNLGDEDKLTYFNLQKYMKHHFTKET